MAIDIVTGAPFSGKGRFVTAEIERRESAGEYGLIRLDWTALYLAVVPGVESALRDDEVADSGAPRFVGLVYATAVAQAVTRELAGYITTNSPRRALEYADQIPGSRILELQASVTELAERTETHLSGLARRVDRASRSTAVAACSGQIGAYLREESRLVGRARTVSRTRSGFKVGGEKRPFDRNLWISGLTPAGRSAVRDLESEGNPAPTPAEVMRRLLGR